jgi:Ti-type conjugative transfer relaxase TraA
MAAFHFCSKIHGRSGGRNAVRAAAYRAGERLYNEREAKTEDYTRKADVIETAILAPAGAPAWVQDRETLWNRVEAKERRKDSQVAQELEINLPRELSEAENWRLITDFCREHLVSHGRICDIAFHLGQAADGETHPHAHILMPTRSLAGDGFGDKHPDVSVENFKKRRDRLQELRTVWCDFARTRALELGIDLGAGWDHRSFEDRGIDLEPQPKVGATAQRMEREGSPAERTAELLDAQRRNGAQLLVNPDIALDALTQRHSTFTHTDLARYAFTHSAEDQYELVLASLQGRAVTVGRDDKGIERFSSAGQIALEQRMVDNASAMADRSAHAVTDSARRLMRSGLSPEQRDAAEHLLQGGDLSCLVGYAGAGKSTMLGEVRRELEAAGYTVRGAALSGIAAQNLTEGSGIEARTLASLRHGWADDRDKLTKRDVLVIDEAGMIGSRELDIMLAEAKTAGAKVIMVGDPQQLQAIEAGAAFRAVAERVGYAELTEIRRQRHAWQREATKGLATGRTAEAISAYREAGMVEQAITDEDARNLLVQRWHEGRNANPDASRIMLAHTNANVRALNEAARATLRQDGDLGPDIPVETNLGTRMFAEGDRLLFRRNERNMGVRNGTLGTISAIEGGKLSVTTDDGRVIAVDPASYQDLDHGYAVTVHKAQGVTVDEAHVLASRGFDRHLSYVSMSRHREKLSLVYSQESFGSEALLAATLGRERQKDTTLDYREERRALLNEGLNAMPPPSPERPAPASPEHRRPGHSP